MIKKLSIIYMMLILSAVISAQDSTVVKVFEDNIVLYGYVQQEGIEISDNGQTIAKEIELDKKSANTKIFASLAVEMNGVGGDPWDRAGTILLSNSIDPDIELLKFMTAYGVPTKHRIDISDLNSVLNGKLKIKVHIPSNPDFIGFKVTFDLVYYENQSSSCADWAKGVFYNSSLELKHIESELTKVKVNIPAGLDKINLSYFTSGHCTDGRGADEFESKYNVIYIDGIEVYRYQPWRDDCENFPSNGNYWLSRSGWCPGDIVKPLILDVTDYLTAGEHEIEFRIEDIRGVDENGNYGYWKVSSYLTGFINGTTPEVAIIDVSTNSSNIIAPNTEVVMKVDYLDNNRNLVAGREKDILIYSDENYVELSTDGVNWKSSLEFKTNYESSLIFVRSNSSGIFDIVINDKNSGKEVVYELLFLENLSLQAEVWGSDSTSSKESPRLACDGDLNTKWSDDSRRFPNTLEFTFNELTDINYFVLYHAGAGGEPSAYNTIDYEIEYLNESNNSWVKIIEVEDNFETEEGNVTKHHLDTKISTKSVRLKILYPEVRGEVANLYEFQMFNVSDELFSDITSINHIDKSVPNDFYLNQNYPNPFNGSTKIEFYVTEFSNVKIYIYDVLGRMVDRVFDGSADSGVHTIGWDAKNSNGNIVAGGTYFCIMEVSSENMNKKISAKKIIYLP